MPNSQRRNACVEEDEKRCGCGASTVVFFSRTTKLPAAAGAMRESGAAARRPRTWLPALLAVGAAALLSPLQPLPASAAPAAFPHYAPAPLPQAFFPTKEEYENAETARNALLMLEAELALDEQRALQLSQMQQAQQQLQEEEQEMEQLLPHRAPAAVAFPGAGAPPPENLPVAMPLVAGPFEPPTKKMKSYMSLCLFKICNMGRKRTNRS